MDNLRERGLNTDRPLPLEELALKGQEALVRGLGTEHAQAFVSAFLKDPIEFQRLINSGTLAGKPLPAVRTNPVPSTPAPRSGVSIPSPVTTGATRLGPHEESRQWLRTGYEILVIPPGQPSFTVPLNFERVTLGCHGPRRNDIELNHPGIANEQAALLYQDGQFVLVNESTTLQVQVNGTSVPRQVLHDNDLLQVGPVRMQVFRLLDVVSELQVVSGADIGKRWKLNKSVLYVGRAGQRWNDIELGDLTVSRSHARLEYHKSTYVLVPESVNNPTRVNGEVLNEPRPLEDHDQVAMGESVLLFRIDRGRGKRSLKPREVTLLFSDLRGYSTIAEREPLKPLIDQLHEYLREMSQIVQLNGGTLLSYQGDALMAVFGAPTRHVDDPDRAVNSALIMLQKLRQLNERWVAEGRPEFHSGIGINTGVAMVGDIGIDEHLEYAAMGDDTNITARIEELTRHYDADLIISEKTFEKLVGLYATDCLGQVTVRGREQPITIYSVRGYANASNDDTAPLSGESRRPAAPPPAPDAPVRFMGIHDTRSQPEIGLQITLDMDKLEAPREDPVGLWRGQLTAESSVNGVVVQYRADAEMTVEASMALRFVCRGEAVSRGHAPVAWGLTGTGYYAAVDRSGSVFLTFSHGSHTSTWTFPVRLQQK